MTSRARRSTFLDWKAVLGIVLGIGFFAFSLRGVEFDAVMREIRRADPILFILSIFFATFPIVVRAWRWKSLLEPVQPGTSFRARYRATMIGFMTNNVLPARIGEFTRGYAFSRMEPVPVAAALASLVVERLLDGLVVVGFLFLAMALPGFPALGAGLGGEFGGTVIGLLAAIGVVAIGLVCLVIWPRPLTAFIERVAGKILPESIRRPAIQALHAFLAGLGALRRPKLVARAGFWSLGVWLVFGYGFWLGFKAFGIELPFSAALFLQSLIALAVALPAAPGFFGVWEAAARVGLHEIWGVELDKAVGFAIGFHIGSFLSVTILGLYYASRLGLSFRDVERSQKAEGDAGAVAMAPPEGSAP